MMQDRLSNEYFDWMYNLVIDNNASYRKLLYFLHANHFSYIIPLDDNRYADGINLRYLFGDLNDYSQSMIATFLDRDDCSVLEMMVALAHRCENEIMSDDAYGDRTGVWFMSMLESLGLDRMDDEYFDKEEANDILITFLHRDYEYNGKGGLFTLQHPKRDLRNVEIWCQLMWYLAELEGDDIYE